VLEPAKAELFGGMSTSEYLRLRGYSQPFVRHYFLPMCAAVWSVSESQVSRHYNEPPDGSLLLWQCKHHHQQSAPSACNVAVGLPSDGLQSVLLQMMEAPIITLVRFWENHHLLDLVQRPVWRVVKDRSRSYVNAICAGKRHACPAHKAPMPTLTKQCVCDEHA
jgi:predicted NAD/FAD-binding protein